MDTLEGRTDFARFVGEHLKSSSFTLLDVGCAGGVHPHWRVFGQRLRAWAFEIDPAECARLQAAEPCREVRYVPGMVGIASDHPFRKARGERPPWAENNPWFRLSISRSVAIRAAAASASAASGHAAAAPEASKPEGIDLNRFIADNAIADVDFIKIDVDGEDFAILSNLDSQWDALNVLGLGIETNFFGTDDPTENTFHNVDRHMKARGFELFALTVRRYSGADLPARYLLGFPAQTEFGRPFQGDAFYARDLCAPDNEDFAQALAPEKLARAAAMFSLNNLPDCAAAIIVKFRDKLAPVMDTDRALDILATEISRDQLPKSYRDYMRAFEADSPPSTPTGSRSLRHTATAVAS